MTSSVRVATYSHCSRVERPRSAARSPAPTPRAGPRASARSRPIASRPLARAATIEDEHPDPYSSLTTTSASPVSTAARTSSAAPPTVTSRWSKPAAADDIERRLQQRPTSIGQQLLGLTQPLRAARGENQSGDEHRLRCRRQRHTRRGSQGCRTSTARRRPSASGCPQRSSLTCRTRGRRPVPEPAHRQPVMTVRPSRRTACTNSATIDKPISCDVRAPMSSPTGVRTRDRSSSVRLSSSSNADPRVRLATRPTNGTAAATADLIAPASSPPWLEITTASAPSNSSSVRSTANPECLGQFGHGVGGRGRRRRPSTAATAVVAPEKSPMLLPTDTGSPPRSHPASRETDRRPPAAPATTDALALTQGTQAPRSAPTRWRSARRRTPRSCRPAARSPDPRHAPRSAPPHEPPSPGRTALRSDSSSAIRVVSRDAIGLTIWLAPLTGRPFRSAPSGCPAWRPRPATASAACRRAGSCTASAHRPRR